MTNSVEVVMPKLSQRHFLMLLIGLDTNESLADEVGGITRLQKYAFLLEREHNVKAENGGYSFVPYKAGPFSQKIYDDLEFLENLGLIESTVVGSSSDAEKIELDKLTFEDLMGEKSELDSDSADNIVASDAFEERHYRLTDKGKKELDQLLKSGDYEPLKDKIRKVKSRFVKHSLNDLLYYVYTHHEDMTVESEIRDRVMRRWYV